MQIYWSVHQDRSFKAHEEKLWVAGEYVGGIANKMTLFTDLPETKVIDMIML